MENSELRAYYKLERELRIQIRSGFLSEHQRLRSENYLAAKYGISRSSVRLALANLEADGLIARKKGSGTFVTPRYNVPVAPKSESGKLILYLSFSSLYSRETFSDTNTFRAVYDGFQAAFAHKNYEFRAAHVGIDWQIPDDLHDPELGGVIFEGVVDKEFFDRYLAKYCCIGVNCYNPELDCSWVLEDSRGIAELSVKHLYSLGYRKIAILSDESSSYPIQEAYHGYRAGLHKVGLPFSEDLVIFWDREKSGGELRNEGLARSSFKPYLEKLFTSADHPDAVICQDHYRAEQTRIALESFGLSIPGDVGLMCRVSLSLKKHYPLIYEGFYARKRDVLAEAAKQIIDDIEGRNVVNCRVTYMRPSLIKGESVRHKENIGNKTEGGKDETK